MNPRPIKNLSLLGLILAGALLALPSHAASSVTNAPATNAPVVLTNAIPLSVFDTGLTNAKDPFFPRSGRRPVESNSGAAENVPDPTTLVLQGLSHSAKRPMATINNHTFSPGEEGEVITPTGRLRIRCDAIHPDSVLVTVGGIQQLELRIPKKY